MNRHLLSSLFFLLILFIPFSCNQSVGTSGTNSDNTTRPGVATTAGEMSPLEAYVKTPDDAFKYDLVDEIKGEGYTTYVVRMVSQKWMTTNEVKDPVWWHWLTLVVPEGAIANTALLFIGGGSHNTKQPTKPDDLALQLALGSNSIVANLHNIPNQPTEFVGDDYGPRVEDELIAYGWRQYLEGGAKDEDNIWMARFPMTKAVVRAMDVISEFTEQNASTTRVEKFVVAGGSKRGWTTWTTGAVDDRVVAIAPIVIDMLNMVPSFEHHWRVYGYWAPAVGNYVAEGIMEWQNAEEYARLNQLTEPYTFREKLTMPKLILNATGDQFFLPDSWQFYWNDLKGEKHLRYVPNSEHSMKKTDALETLLSFYQMILAEQQRPDFDWKVKDGKIHIQTDVKYPPKEITLWQAHNPNARNFQVDSIGRAYQPSRIPLSNDGKYTVGVKTPNEGWTAFFAELTYPGLGEIPFKLTTGVVVTPDVYPFEPFKNPNPRGTQVKKENR